MGLRTYRTLRLLSRFVKTQCATERILGVENVPTSGGCLVAPTHVSHVEPMIVSTILHRTVYWMARREFYKFAWSRRLLNHVMAFSVHRQGVPVSSIRKAIGLTTAGEVVGIFPEGGCRVGKHLAIRGGRIKQGVCVVALRSQVPIVPIVVLGTNRMTHVSAWFPGKHTKLWIAFGQAIVPPPRPARADRRRVREELALQVEAEYQRLYRMLVDEEQVSDAITP